MEVGIILPFSGPHIGTKYDAHIFMDNWDSHPVLKGEYGLGDGHYTSLPFIIGPKTQPHGGHLSDVDYITNAVISHY